MGEELRQVVVVDLFRQTMVWGDEHVFQQAFLVGREVGEPPAHVCWLSIAENTIE